MPLLRTMLSALVAIAIVLAPIVSAWAAVKKSPGAQVNLAHGDVAEHSMVSAATQMKDCASSMKGSSSTDDCRSAESLPGRVVPGQVLPAFLY